MNYSANSKEPQQEKSHKLSGEEFRNRILSVACYFGLSPFLWFFKSFRRKNPLVDYHLLYSLAFDFIVIWMIVIQIAAEVFLYWIFGSDMQSPVAWGLSIALTIVLLIVSSVWQIIWSISALGAILGRVWRIPVIAQVARMKFAVNFTVYLSLLLTVFSLWLIGIGIHSAQIASTPPQKADVYVLYTVGGYLPVSGYYETYTPPKWAVVMTFYPLVRAGMDKFGDDRVSVLPLSEETFSEAIQNGRFIFIASHGGISPGKITMSTLPYQEYGPADVPQNLIGNQLQFVYFAGCDAGILRSDWLRVLHLEDAIMFDRISIVGEHLFWVWTKSPSLISGLN